MTPPDTGFDCDEQIEGYYSDQDADCQAFHICGNDGSGSLIKYSFLCPNGESPLSLLLVHMIILFTLQGLCSTSSTSSVIGGLTWTVLRSDRSAQYLIKTDSSLLPQAQDFYSLNADIAAAAAAANDNREGRNLDLSVSDITDIKNLDGQARRKFSG